MKKNILDKLYINTLLLVSSQMSKISCMREQKKRENRCLPNSFHAPKCAQYCGGNLCLWVESFQEASLPALH